MSIADLSVRNPVFVNLIVVLIFVVGIYSMIIIPKEEMPQVDFGSSVIIVMYPGVSPEEIEQLIIDKIEAQIASVDGIDFIHSRAEEGRATIRVVFEPRIDPDKAYDDLVAELAKVTDLPADAFDPTIIRINMREVNSMAQIAMSGDYSPNSMRQIAEQLQEGLQNIRHVARIDVFGTRDRQIWIEGDAARLEHYGLSLNDLIDTIRLRNMNVPAGTIKSGRMELIVRTVGQFNSLEEIARLVVNSDPQGRFVRIEDVATIRDTLENVVTISKLDGRESVNMSLYKKADGNIISVMNEVRQYVAEFQESIPGLQITIRNDGSEDVKTSLLTLGNSALLGIILVFITLFIFLGWRNATLAAWGIPFSFLLTFILMQISDITMNQLTLFGLVLVLGMIVDNAIVVIENMHRQLEMGYCQKTSAVKGTNEVMIPVIASAATTAAAFLPLLLMEGVMGQFMRVFPLVITAALAASLFQSLFILPAHLSLFTKPLDEKKKKSKILIYLVTRYRRTLIFVLKHRVKSVLGFIFVFILAVLAMMSGLVKFEFYPQPPPTTIALQIQTPDGTNIETTNRIVSQVENYILNMEESRDIKSLVTNVGSMRTQNRMERRSSYSQIAIELIDYREMKYTHDEIRNAIRRYIDAVPGIYTYNFDVFRAGPPVGRDVEIRIRGDNLDRLQQISGIVQDELRNIPGVVDIGDSFAEGKQELRIIPIQDRLSMYGLTVAQFAMYVRTALTGSTVSAYRGDGFKEYDVVVMMKEEYVDELSKLQNLTIRPPGRTPIQLADLAEFEIDTGLASIEHRNRRRVVTITANAGFYEENGRRVRRRPGEVTEILMGSRIRGTEGVLSGFEGRFPGYQIEFGGMQEEQARSYRSLYLAFAVALLLVYTILATQFRSYVQPLIVMMTIPFAFIGVVFGLVVTQLPFSLNTFIAVIALAGVVVNNSIILVDFVNKERDKGIDRWNSLINAGSVRLRPILLTTITTIMGLVPMMLSTARSSVVWKPMAVSISFGLAFSTMLTLFLIPTIYSLLDSFFGKLKLTRFKSHEKFEEVVCKEELD
ncbi:MAG: efflux RND transporter permease subunit [Candidatus Cloacimonetes bacterium]|nr:efflux RND transporter permease subunit [Candidatus Cloacimonadota bacterium]